MKYIDCQCATCGKSIKKEIGHYNRSIKLGMKLFCGQECFGVSRRKNLTKAQKVANKAEYDREYREKNREMLKHKKHERFKKTYDPVQAAIKRKERMPKHIEYCRQPEYKKWKVEYDKQYRAKKEYGEFAECFLITQQIFSLIDNREIKYINGLTNKTQIRKRQWQTQQNNKNLPPMPSKALYGKH